MINATQKLETLKTIAETLNESQNKTEMLQSVLDQIITISHFESGWIFMEEDGIILAADKGLPPALERHNKSLMCGEDCYCVSKYQKGILTQATTIIECKRIEDAMQIGDADTNGLTHHATVPLKTPEKSYGLLNVGTPGTREYKKEELDMLESIAYQMGTALRRIEQFEKEEERAKLFEKLHQFTHSLYTTRSLADFWDITCSSLKQIFEFVDANVNTSNSENLKTSMKPNTYYFNMTKSNRLLSITRPNSLNSTEKEVIQFAVQYIELAYKELLLQEKQENVARIQERSKLAQDLHDSVNQLLFSVVLTTKGARTIAKEREVVEQLTYIEEISTQALKEMRSLITEYKPQGLEEGVLAGLVKYAQTIGLHVKKESVGTENVPYFIQEALWRIGQEALHNIDKHAQSKDVQITLARSKEAISLKIEDNGIGFDLGKRFNSPSYGLKGMSERANLYSGTVDIKSEKGKGTIVSVTIPIKEEGDKG